jgi:outer membrane protein TolC
MKKVAIFLLTIVYAGMGQQKLSLEEAIRVGLSNNKLAQISSARAEGADARAGEARAALLPSVRFEGSYRRLSDVDPFRVQIPGVPTPIVISPVVLDNYTTRVSLQQPIFTGFKLRSNARSAEYLAQAAAAETKNDRADVVLSIISAYWTVYQARETKKAADENVARLESYVKDGENMLKAGMLTRGDLLRLQVQLSNGRLTQIDAANDARLAEMNCDNVLGLPLETSLELTSSPVAPVQGITVTPTEGIQSMTMRALQDRPDIRATASRLEAARAGVAAVNGNWWPQVFLSGSYYYSRPNSRWFPTRDEWKGTWDLGVVVQLDLWNWGTTLRQTEQASAALRQQELLYAQMTDNAILDVTRAELQVRRAREKVEVALLAVDQADENLRIMQQRFKSGTATPTELLDAEVALLQAMTGRTGALIENAVADARLAKSIGGLNN